MRILGIDPGTLVCGYGAIDVGPRGDAVYVECGVLTANKKQPLADRLGELARSLVDVITELRPVAVAVEDAFFSVNARSALALAHARGVALAVAGLAGLPVHSYTPAAVKSTVTGRGRASKEQVAHMVSMLMGLRSMPRSDAADALAVALTHARWVARQRALEEPAR
ncbi:MAG TPA: crossover junction endodeoxyribonuclease RuvC [Kofleriaceae bacterium]|nr:crossover junction endodeoxyribonuclease RuvC [Kofleriaceae bacterium]